MWAVECSPRSRQRQHSRPKLVLTIANLAGPAGAEPRFKTSGTKSPNKRNRGPNPPHRPRALHSRIVEHRHLFNKQPNRRFLHKKIITVRQMGSRQKPNNSKSILAIQAVRDDTNTLSDLLDQKVVYLEITDTWYVYNGKIWIAAKPLQIINIIERTIIDNVFINRPHLQSVQRLMRSHQPRKSTKPRRDTSYDKWGATESVTRQYCDSKINSRRLSSSIRRPALSVIGTCTVYFLMLQHRNKQCRQCQINKIELNIEAQGPEGIRIIDQDSDCLLAKDHTHQTLSRIAGDSSTI